MENIKKDKENWISFELKYNEGDRVEHVISGDEGVVLSWRIYGGADRPSYHVSFNPQYSEWFNELELKLVEERTGFFGFGKGKK
jgi:hypothetical protein